MVGGQVHAEMQAIGQIREQFLRLHGDVGALMNDASHLHPSLWLAALSIHGAVSASVRGLLVAANDVLAGIRGRLDVTLSVVLALVALLVSVVPIMVGLYQSH